MTDDDNTPKIRRISDAQDLKSNSFCLAEDIRWSHVDNNSSSSWDPPPSVDKPPPMLMVDFHSNGRTSLEDINFPDGCSVSPLTVSRCSENDGSNVDPSDDEESDFGPHLLKWEPSCYAGNDQTVDELDDLTENGDQQVEQRESSEEQSSDSSLLRNIFQKVVKQKSPKSVTQLSPYWERNDQISAVRIERESVYSSSGSPSSSSCEASCSERSHPYCTGDASSLKAHSNTPPCMRRDVKRSGNVVSLSVPNFVDNSECQKTYSFRPSASANESQGHQTEQLTQLSAGIHKL